MAWLYPPTYDGEKPRTYSYRHPSKPAALVPFSQVSQLVTSVCTDEQVWSRSRAAPQPSPLS